MEHRSVVEVLIAFALGAVLGACVLGLYAQGRAEDLCAFYGFDQGIFALNNGYVCYKDVPAWPLETLKAMAPDDEDEEE